MLLPHLWRRFPHTLPDDPGRVAYIDGDGLAYTQSGPAGTSRGQARINVISKVAGVARATNTKDVRVFLTESGSHKGHRYAIATVKPYQGQRSSGRRPENWEYLRGLLESRSFNFPIIGTRTAEADDLFAEYAHKADGNIVICTQDKDMRMIPAIHLTWDDYHLLDNRDGADVVFMEKQYGLRWFWLQMLMGDGADHIPGLPKFFNGKSLVLCGEVTAGKILGHDPSEYLIKTMQAYSGFYGPDAQLHMLEQGALLWMRRNPSDPLDVAHPAYGPLAPILAVQPTLRDKFMERIPCD